MTESAQDFLTRVNFKSVIEWLTAECILNRPDDPMQYCRNLLDIKVSERQGKDYQPEAATEIMRACYAEASSTADEHGIIHGKVLTPATSSIDSQMEAMKMRLTLFEKLCEASRAVSQHLDPTEACNCIVHESCGILRADRASIFLLTPDKKMLKLHVAEGNLEITVPVGVGIAGTVAQTGEVMNITDAYNDSRFDPSSDQKSGYKTDTILCGPIRNQEGLVLGVVQIINKANGVFNAEDEDIMSMFSLQAGVAVHNAELWQAAQTTQRQFRAMIDIVRAMYADMGINSLIFTLTNRVPSVVNADRCTVYIIEHDSRELWVMQGEVNFKVPMDAPGLASTCAREGTAVNISDAYADDRFNQDIDKKTGYKTNNILCMPIKAKGETIGVIQIINKLTGAFSSEDEELLETFLDIAGHVLASSKLVHKKKETVGTTGSEIGELSTTKAERGGDMEGMAAFAEGEDDEEDDGGF